MKKTHTFAKILTGIVLAGALYILVRLVSGLGSVAALMLTLFLGAAIVNVFVRVAALSRSARGVPAWHPSQDNQQQFWQQQNQMQMQMHEQAVQAHQQFVDQMQQQQFNDFCRQCVTPIQDGGFVPTNFGNPMF